MRTLLSRHRIPPVQAMIAWPILALAMLGLALQSGLLQQWVFGEEYGHGAAVIAVLGYLVYRRRSTLPQTSPALGLATLTIVTVPFAVMFMGFLAGITQLQMYGVWLYAVALAYVVGGHALVLSLVVPLAIALMTIPLPSTLEWALTAKLQLLSSELGVWFIRLFGGVAHLQGNVIDMGNFRLLVDEACSGLRYLYPLMGLGAIAASVFSAPLWSKWLLLLATVPITVFMNSLRIGITGLLADRYGPAHTEGFLHFFEGWVVFVAALMALAAFAWMLLRVSRVRTSLLDAFTLCVPDHQPANLRSRHLRDIGRSAQRNSTLALVLSLALALLAGPALSSRAEIAPARMSFSEFPVQLGSWVSRPQRLPLAIEAVAGASDYYYGNFSSADGGLVNLYLSYYASQRGGSIPHSPVVCLPGDGWRLASVDTTHVESASGTAFEVSRLVATKGYRTVVGYYWLKQGATHHHQEVIARLDLLRSAVVNRRSDGALVRLVAELGDGESLGDVDSRLQVFAGEMLGVLPDFVPD